MSNLTVVTIFVLLLLDSASAFNTRSVIVSLPARRKRTTTATNNPRSLSRHTTQSTRTTVLFNVKNPIAAARAPKHHSAFAGKLFPILQKLLSLARPSIFKQVVKNVVSVTDWNGVAILFLLAYGTTIPAVKYMYEQKLAQEPKERPYRDRKRFRVALFISELAKVGLSVYAVDILCVVLTTLGFTFPNTWQVPYVYAKVAYSAWGLRRFLQLKTRILCRIYKVSRNDMGRVEILDRLLNGIFVTVGCLLLADWLSFKFGMTMGGIIGFGSFGTLAFTLASQGLVSQLLSGIYLAASNKMYVGDNVQFGDGTSGKIVKLGWMETLLRGSDNTVTSVPNIMLSSQKISNLSRIGLSQVRQTLRFHYEDVDEIPKLLETIRSEIKESCPDLVKDGSRPFRVYWTNYNEDHLEVMVDTHHYVPPIGDGYWETRQNVLMAINRAVKKHNMPFAELDSHSPSDIPMWRVKPRKQSIEGVTNGEKAQ